MTTQYTQEGTTINRDIVFSSLQDEIQKPDTSKPFLQNVKTWSGFGATVTAIFGSAIFLFGESGTPNIPRPSVKNTSASVQWNFGEEIKSGVTQEFVDTQQRLAFPTYDEEDILNWDAVVVPPPPRRSGTIRVKLIYKGRSKPIPDENPWE